MNIFVLDQDPAAAAGMHCDKHVVKMILEYAQLLSAAHRLHDGRKELFEGEIAKPKYFYLLGDERVVEYEQVYEYEDEEADEEDGHIKTYSVFKLGIENPICYALSHHNHPCAVWARANSANYSWLVRLLRSLLDEYTIRYNKRHSTEKVMGFLSYAPKNIPGGELTPFAQAMPEEYKHADAVEAYRRFYAGSKSRFAKWTGPIPNWFINRMEGQDVSLFTSTRNLDRRTPVLSGSYGSRDSIQRLPHGLSGHGSR